MTGNQKIDVVDWGLLDYQQALDRQNVMVQKRQSGAASDCLVVVEHPPSVTLGRRGNETDLRIAEDLLKSQGVALYRIDRGGQATAHEPRQMVAYPVLSLQKKDLHCYVQTFLGSVAKVLREYGLDPEFKEGEPGLWVNGGKIASFGIAVKKWVTSHGVALNVSNDLSTFNLIVPCGKPTEIVTSMERELGQPVDLAEVKERFVSRFCEAFDYRNPLGERFF